MLIFRSNCITDLAVAFLGFDCSMGCFRCCHQCLRWCPKPLAELRKESSWSTLWRTGAAVLPWIRAVPMCWTDGSPWLETSRVKGLFAGHSFAYSCRDDDQVKKNNCADVLDTVQWSSIVLTSCTKEVMMLSCWIEKNYLQWLHIISLWVVWYVQYRRQNGRQERQPIALVSILHSTVLHTIIIKR